MQAAPMVWVSAPYVLPAYEEENQSLDEGEAGVKQSASIDLQVVTGWKLVQKMFAHGPVEKVKTASVQAISSVLK